MTVTAHNIGRETAPYGTSIHPYFVAGPGTVDDWTLDLAAGEVLMVDPERLLPRERSLVANTGFDFRSGRRIGRASIDHAFTSINFDARGDAQAKLTTDDGTGVRLTWDKRCGWVQVHTTDLPQTPLHRTALVIEPMTCPPDAFSSKDGLVDLAPGERYCTRWRIDAIGR